MYHRMNLFFFLLFKDGFYFLVNKDCNCRMAMVAATTDSTSYKERDVLVLSLEEKHEDPPKKKQKKTDEENKKRRRPLLRESWLTFGR